MSSEIDSTPRISRCEKRTKLKANIAEHLKLAKAETDTKKDPTLTAIDKGQTDMLTQMEKAIAGKCGGASGGTTKTPAKTPAKK